MDNAGGVAPLREILRLVKGDSRGGALGGEPERELVGGMEMERAAECPRLDELAPLPQRCPDVRLRDAGDAGRELQLRRRLDLRVHAPDLAGDLHESVAAGRMREEASREPSCANLGPRRRSHRGILPSS